MEQKVLAFIKENQLIKGNSRVLVGVSGGPDSLALLYFLHRNQSNLNIELSAMTVDHQLRGKTSVEDALFVEAICAQLHIPCMTCSVDVMQYKQDYQIGTQVAARTLRYGAFAEIMKEHQIDYLALGHHADDQIETVMMQITKTTNLHSLTGIPLTRSFQEGNIIRPFLCVTKAEIEQYCEQQKLQPRIDESNAEKAYTRNRIRSDIIPKLKKENPNMATTIMQLTKTIQEDETYLMNEAKRLFTGLVETDLEKKRATISIKGFLAYPVALQRRLFRLTLDYLYVTIPEQITYKHETAFLTLLTQKGHKVLHFPKQCKIEKSYDTICCHFAEDIKSPVGYEQTITTVPSRFSLPNGAQLSVRRVDEIISRVIKSEPHTYLCPEEALDFPFSIRTRKPGDRMTYQGLAGTKKIKDIFIDEKTPLDDRESWCMLTDNQGMILWLIGLRKHPQEGCSPSGSYFLFEYIEENR